MEIESSADNLVIVYKDDLEQCFSNELVQFVAFSNEFLKDADGQHRQRTFSLQACHR